MPYLPHYYLFDLYAYASIAIITYSIRLHICVTSAIVVLATG